MIRFFQNYYLLSLLFLALVGCTTEFDPTVSAPKVFFKSHAVEMGISDTLLLAPQVAYDEGSTYQWFLNSVEIPNSNSRVLEVITHDEFKSDKYLFKVTNNLGTDTASIIVQSLVKVDFEEFKFANKTHTIGYNGSSVLKSKLLNLPVKNDSVNKYWCGFAISKLKIEAQSDSSKYQFYVWGSGGDEKSLNFAVFYEDIFGDNNFITFNDGKSHRIGNIAITNNAYTYYVMRVGAKNPFARQYTTPNDFLKIRITGYDENGGVVKESDFFLANYTFSEKDKNFSLNKWSNCDLSSFGKISKLGFKFQSFDTGANGINTPTYFCLDNIRIIE